MESRKVGFRLSKWVVDAGGYSPVIAFLERS
jgi:hypothetical protein